jgi:hypothetical protein
MFVEFDEAGGIGCLGELLEPDVQPGLRVS